MREQENPGQMSQSADASLGGALLPPIGRPVSDPDAPAVGPRRAGMFLIGAGITGVNDGAEEPVDAVRISRHEADVLYKYWWGRYRETRDWCRITLTSGSANGALTPSYRIKQIPGCRGRHDRIINRHLASLRHIIRSKSGPSGGYWICLPQEVVQDDAQ